MKKIPTMFKREHDGDDTWRGSRLCIDEVRPGCEWVFYGEGAATEKIDGTSCLIREGKLYKRICRKPTKKARKAFAELVHAAYDNPALLEHQWLLEHYKPALNKWESCDVPAYRTGVWPGWVPVNALEPSDTWHIEAYGNLIETKTMADGTYELVGPKVQSNPYKLDKHELWKHGVDPVYFSNDIPMTFDRIRAFLTDPDVCVEGLVWYHSDGRMAKIKRRDFGLSWPIKTTI